MYSFGGTMPVSNSTVEPGSSPVCSKQVGHISTMQSPNDPGIGSSRSAGSSGALITDGRSILEQKLTKVEAKLRYFEEQVDGAKYDLDDLVSKRPFYIQRGQNNL
jgi:hypothetical protein